MSDDPNTKQLYLFCIAANHETCDTWQEHRVVLDQQTEIIKSQLRFLDDIRKIGQSRQDHARSGQASVFAAFSGELWDKVPVLKEPEVDKDAIVEVYWTYDESHHVWTAPGFKDQEHKEDCRSVSTLRYKPRRVHVFFNGEPDGWNRWK